MGLCVHDLQKTLGYRLMLRVLCTCGFAVNVVMECCYGVFGMFVGCILNTAFLLLMKLFIHDLAWARVRYTERNKMTVLTINPIVYSTNRRLHVISSRQ